MKKLVAICLSTLVAGLSLAASPVRIDGVAAYVNAHVITISDVIKAEPELQRRLARGEEGAELNETYREALDSVIAQKLVLDDYENQKAIRIPDAMVEERVEGVIDNMFGGNRDDLLTALARDGMSEELWRDQIRNQITMGAMRNLRVDSQVAVSPLAVRRRYDENLEAYTTEPKVKLRMIVLGKGESDLQKVAQQAKLDDLMAQLKDGGDFAELARKMSEGSRAEEGGDRGWMARDMLRADLAKVAFDVPVGDVSEPIDIGKQVCILKVEDRVEADTEPFVDVQPEIERELHAEMSQELYKAWIDRLRRSAYVKIVDESPF